MTGEISNIDTVRNEATLGNMTYKFHPDAVAYDKSGKKISLRRLLKGTRVGLEMKRSETKEWYITAFWIIDKSQPGVPNEG